MNKVRQSLDSSKARFCGHSQTWIARAEAQRVSPSWKNRGNSNQTDSWTLQLHQPCKLLRKRYEKPCCHHASFTMWNPIEEFSEIFLRHLLVDPMTWCRYSRKECTSSRSSWTNNDNVTYNDIDMLIDCMSVSNDMQQVVHGISTSLALASSGQLWFAGKNPHLRMFLVQP